MLLDRFAEYPVEVRTNVQRREIVDDGVIIGDGEKIPTDTFWPWLKPPKNTELKFATDVSPD